MFPIRRALTRTFSMSAGTGIDGYPYTDLEVSFAMGGTNWRIGGTSIYTDALPDNTDFTNLFDQYRIRSVYVRVDVPAGLFNGVISGIIFPHIFYAPDYDDVSSTTKAQILQYPQMKEHSFYTQGYQPLLFRFTPKPLRDIAASGVLTAYGPTTESPWLRTVDTIVPHYGMKFVFDYMNLSGMTTFPMEFTVWFDLEFTNPK